MKYPDGSTIRVGDLIWWNEGECVGYVQVVAESKEEYGNWGLAAPHIFVSNIHPFDPALRNVVAYIESSLADDGIGLLTSKERLELEQATSQARTLAVMDLDGSTYAVTTDAQNCRLVAWIITFIKGDKAVETVRVPGKERTGNAS